MKKLKRTISLSLIIFIMLSTLSNVFASNKNMELTVVKTESERNI